MIALAIDMMWMSPYVLPLHAVVAIRDARLVHCLRIITRNLTALHVNVVDNATTGVSVEILARCASSYQFADLCLAFVDKVVFGWGLAVDRICRGPLGDWIAGHIASHLSRLL
jgi:hypothetical protein